MDNLTKEQRHKNMVNIKNKNTKPEELVRKYLFSKGLRYRKNVKTLPGCPDLVFPKYKTIVFINGCFWHQHENCRYAVMPKTNKEYWKKKLKRNIERDKSVQQELIKLGWNIITVWECELKKKQRDNTLESLYLKITNKNIPE